MRAVLPSWKRSGLLGCTPMLLRPRAPKSNPHETATGKFDKSFEKLTAQIEERLPMSQRNIIRGSAHDRLFGEESEVDLKKAAQDDLHGREEEKPAARVARSYFSDQDLSPEALHVRSPRLKVAQNYQRLQYDKSTLNTSREAPEYYYSTPTPEALRRRRIMQAAGSIVFCVLGVYSWRAASSYMLSG